MKKWKINKRAILSKQKKKKGNNNNITEIVNKPNKTLSRYTYSNRTKKINHLERFQKLHLRFALAPPSKLNPVSKDKRTTYSKIRSPLSFEKLAHRWTVKKFKLGGELKLNNRTCVVFFFFYDKLSRYEYTLNPVGTCKPIRKDNVQVFEGEKYSEICSTNNYYVIVRKVPFISKPIRIPQPQYVQVGTYVFTNRYLNEMKFQKFLKLPVPQFFPLCITSGSKCCTY